jgi:nucleoside-diphosphate-sugar epimerase
MTTLVLGATGATGRHLVTQLLARGEHVRAMVRSLERVPDQLRDERVELVEGNVLELDDAGLDELVAGCTGFASCLGHNLTFKGIYGHPRRLVADSVTRVCEAIHRMAPEKPVRFTLMNTAGNSNRDLDEPLGLGARIVIGALRVALPPHPDNEEAADYLRVHVGQADDRIEWVVVRPDSLIDEDEVTPWTAHASPTRDAIFNAGKTSRINVGAFMADLLTKDELWTAWKGQMPVLYNDEREAPQALAA